MFLKIAAAQSAEVLEEDAFNTRLADRRLVEYDPNFIYVSVRALSSDVPNSNFDCFTHNELTRVDTVLNRPIYASFVGRGVFVNHRETSDPRVAKGIVLDARYNQDDPNDKYVELLLGISKDKDPLFARDVERGLISSWSMGASVGYTKCSICGNQARSKDQFCDHISKYKGRECRTADGTKKIAYEECYQVQYNELSAVSDPADPTAQSLSRIANKTIATPDNKIANTSKPANTTTKPPIANKKIAGISQKHTRASFNKNKVSEKVNSALPDDESVILKEIAASMKKVEAHLMKKAANRKTADIPGGPAPVDAAPPDAMPDAAPGDEFGGPGDLGGEGEPNVGAEVARLLADILDGNIPAEEAVQQIQSLVPPAEMTDEMPPPGEENGEAPPPPADMGGGGPVANRQSFSNFLRKVAGEYRKSNGTVKNMPRKTAEDKGSKVKNQYPNYKPQGDPSQSASAPSHYKMHKSRPSSDFASDKKDYAKQFNISAEFIPSGDRRTAAWKVCDGDKPLYLVTAEGAFEDALDTEVDGRMTGWSRFSSRSYGEDLIRAILEDGLEATMERVGASPLNGYSKTAEGDDNTPSASTSSLDNEKLLKAAEAKAADLADELTEDWKIRFIEGMRAALTLQSKNVIDNPIKAAAYEVLSEAGLDGSLAEKVAGSEIVNAHFEEAMKKAVEYSEMDPDAFEQVRAHVDSLPSTRVVEAKVSGASKEDIDDITADVERELMIKRASRNIGGIRTPSGEKPSRGFDERITAAVRAGLSNTSVPKTPLTYGPRPRS